ncbi:hypothetical protein ACFX2G_021795 [Malus domestica]
MRENGCEIASRFLLKLLLIVQIVIILIINIVICLKSKYVVIDKKLSKIGIYEHFDDMQQQQQGIDTWRYGY